MYMPKTILNRYSTQYGWVGVAKFLILSTCVCSVVVWPNTAKNSNSNELIGCMRTVSCRIFPYSYSYSYSKFRFHFTFDRYQPTPTQLPNHIPPPFWYVDGQHTALKLVLKNKKITDAHLRLWLVNWPNRVPIQFGPIEQPPTTATATGNERQLRLTGLFTQH